MEGEQEKGLRKKGGKGKPKVLAAPNQSWIFKYFLRTLNGSKIREKVTFQNFWGEGKSNPSGSYIHPSTCIK